MDVTNLRGETQGRTAQVKARRDIQSHQRRFARRGNPKQGARAKCRTVAANVGESAPTEPTTLSDVMVDNHIISDTSEHLQQYINRNATYEAQKAMAITVMTTAITKWGCSILEAANRAADCCGFSSKTVRKWASSYIISTCTLSPDDITDEFITGQLSSNRGDHDTHTGSLLHDEDFQLAARTFVRKHACRKGQPNLTCKMFADWIDEEYGQRIHDDTARRWMISLGFSRVHHQKGVYFDGHDRDDVVVNRNNFKGKWRSLTKNLSHAIVVHPNWHLQRSH